MNSAGILVSDFDGTMTRRDFYRVALERLPASSARWWTAYEQGELSHFNALARIFEEVRFSREIMEELIREMQVEPDLRQASDRLARGGWRLVVASAGCGWYIEKILKEAGLTPELHTNPGEFHEGEGLKMQLPTQSAFFDPETGIDKAAVVRQALAETQRVAYAGDGRPDLAPTLLVCPQYRFARGWLAGELRRRGEPFTPFDRWEEIAGKLLEAAPSSPAASEERGRRR